MRAIALYPTQACFGLKDDNPLGVKLGSCRKFRIVRAKPDQNVPRSFCHLQRSCEVLAHVRCSLKELNLASFDSRPHAAIGRWPETSRNRWSAKGRSSRSKRRPICIVKFWSKKDA